MKLKSRHRNVSFLSLLFLLLPVKVLAHDPNAKADGEGALFHHYTWWELWNPLLVLTLVAIFAIYVRVMKRMPSNMDTGISLKKKLAFLSGLIAAYAALAGPLAILANNLVLSAHMLQQSLMYVVMPPLVLLGMPIEFYRFLNDRVFNVSFLRILKSPWLHLLLFNLLWSFYHLPFIYEYILEHILLLEVVHVVINTSAFLMWIHVLAPEGLINRMSYVMKMGYMFANGMLITPACALIIFSATILYSSVLEAPQLFLVPTPLDDQQLGGVIMKVVQEFSYSLVIGSIFVKWVKTEKETEVPLKSYPAGL